MSSEPTGDNPCATTLGEQHELMLTRVIDASPSVLYRCWTEPELMKQWFTPRPWITPVIETDVRVGGSSYVLMRGPAGEEHASRGVYLDLVPDRKIVFTDAYTSAWELSGKPFFTGILTFEALDDGRTRYTARARHWSAADRDQHEAMGFHEGWGKATDQLETLARSL